MTRRRLRPKHSDAALASLYATPHEHSRWWDHRFRVEASIALCRTAVEVYDLRSAADLSAGDASIITSLGVRTQIGDFASGYEFVGPIEETLDQIAHTDLFICSETLEHLDNPDLVLDKIAKKANFVFVSTPLDEANADNPEHYWSWGREDISSMLSAAGFYQTLAYSSLVFPGLGDYGYQLHLAAK